MNVRDLRYASDTITMQKNELRNIRIIRVGDGFNEKSLDGFIVRQRVTHCWRKVDGGYKLVPVRYTEEWKLSERRVKARSVISAVKRGAAAFAAIAENAVVGFALVSNDLFGSEAQFAELVEFYVSEPFRRRGIGRRLFEFACRQAKEFGAKKLYVSAHSAKESAAAYQKYGFVFTQEPDAGHIDKEPCDLQLEYDLSAF